MLWAWLLGVLASMATCPSIYLFRGRPHTIMVARPPPCSLLGLNLVLLDQLAPPDWPQLMKWAWTGYGLTEASFLSLVVALLLVLVVTSLLGLVLVLQRLVVASLQVLVVAHLQVWVGASLQAGAIFLGLLFLSADIL